MFKRFHDEGNTHVVHGAPCNPDPRHVEIEESLLLDIVEALLLGLASSFGALGEESLLLNIVETLLLGLASSFGALLLVLEQASNGKQLQ